MPDTRLPRRQFLATLAAGIAPLPAKEIAAGSLPTRMFGRTGQRLPLLACGGSALVERWGMAYGVKLAPFAKRVEMVRAAYDAGIRYFDTSRCYLESESIYGEALKDVRPNIFLATKVGVKADNSGLIARQDVRANVEESLRMLKTDHVDAIQIHGPVFEYNGTGRAMEIYEELDKLRGEKMFRYIGVTAHSGFETMYKLIDTQLFDQAFLAYGYFPKGMVTMLSPSNLAWREKCLARARELGMGLLAMKVLGSFVMGRNAAKVVPDYSEAQLAAVRRAALRWALRHKQPPLLVVGISVPEDIALNVETLRGALAYTPEDERLLAKFTDKAMSSKQVQSLKTV